MINDAISGSGAYSAAQSAAAANQSVNQAKSNEKATRTASDKGVSDTDDTVEISEEARALSLAAQQTGQTASNAANTQSKVAGQYATREQRDSEGERYDAVLNDLRSQYNEEEAMARFNDFMRAEGFEVQGDIGDETMTPMFRPSDKGYLLVADQGIMPFLKMGGLKKLGGEQSYSWSMDSNLNTYSKIVGRQSGQDMVYEAATWAAYSASYGINDFKDSVDEWKYLNVDKLADQSGIDVKAYVDTLSLKNYDAFSAESVSMDLGSIVKNLLEKGGIELSSDQQIGFVLDTNEQGQYTRLSVSTNLDDEAATQRIQSLFDSAIKSDPSILRSFADALHSTEKSDTSRLPDAYASGSQSLEFQQERRFVYSGNEPSAVVMGSTLSVRSKGYTYQKKLSSEIDFGCDMLSAQALRSKMPSVDSPLSSIDSALVNTVSEKLAEYYQQFKNGTVS